MPRTFAQLPGYEIAARIGRGAGAIIYEARKKGSRELVAVKHVVRHGPEDDRYIQQAETEYEVGSKVDHPALRKCLDIVRIRRWLKISELYVVLEHVDGVRLEDRPPTDIEAMVHTFIRIADGLHAMHKLGYAHADIKPNNVLVTNSGELKIIDFGQSCHLGHTKERIQGTPDYMAPEQALKQPIDQRTDVFNLGATMYWVTTGKWFKTLMNRGETGMKKSEVDARSDSAPPIEINAAVPLTLSQLIMECCESRKENRPREMHIVSSRLGLVLDLLHQRRIKPAAESARQAQA